MDGETQVPLNWVFGLAGILITAFIWWLKIEFAKNDRQHMEAQQGIKSVHKRIDFMIIHLLPHKPFHDHDD